MSFNQIKHVKNELKNIKEDKSNWYYKGPFDEDTIQQKFIDAMKNIAYNVGSEEYYDNLSKAVYLQAYGSQYDLDNASKEVLELYNRIKIKDQGNTYNNSSVLTFEWFTFCFEEDDVEITAISIYMYGDVRSAGYSEFIFVYGDLCSIYEEAPYIDFGSEEVNITQHLLAETGLAWWRYEDEDGDVQDDESYIRDDDEDVPSKVKALTDFVLGDHLYDTKFHRYDYLLKQLGPFVFIFLDGEIQKIYLDRTKVPGFGHYEAYSKEDEKFREKIFNLEKYVCPELETLDFDIKNLKEDFEILEMSDEKLLFYREINGNIVEVIEVDLDRSKCNIFQTTMESDDLSFENKEIIKQNHLEKVTPDLPLV